MANADNKYGVYNKQTKIFYQGDVYDYEVLGDTDRPEILRDKTVFANVDAAKAFYFTTDALAVWDETCTQIQWALVNDDNGDASKLKVTFAFGTKGNNIAAGDDWAGQYNSRKTTLMNIGEWHTTTPSNSNPRLVTDDSTHLF